ncbi:hypothetical protein HB770_04130 [Rhizobium leguminosarum bv. viciae]|uniref:Uncharacterized protein n=1 Tax=Rhizobium leguminosarum bv. viciae TaxID=387 RepID=A0A7G6RHV2_RHILV|nr:hypothetical protein HB770_04130 [Rhizobium leguminosarum bv. viciae]
MSIVPVGADPNAIVTGTRGKTLYPLPTFTQKRSRRSKTRTKERTMDEDQISDLVDTAEAAIDDVTAALEDADDAGVDVSDDLLARARGLRKFRGKRSTRADDDDTDQTTAPKSDDDDVDATRGKRKGRADGDEDADLEAQLEEQLRKLRSKRKARADEDAANDDDLTPDEEADADQAVRTAKRASDELGQFARLLRANGAKGPQIRKAVLRELTKNGARGVSTEGLTPSTHSIDTSSAATRSRYAKLNAKA